MSKSPRSPASSPVPPRSIGYVPAGSMIMLGSALAFAAMMASRNEQSASQKPSSVSAVFVTVKTLGPADVVSVSNPPRAYDERQAEQR